jgi:archaeosine-15-forming tRNA-guanine transglycosylase
MKDIKFTSGAEKVLYRMEYDFRKEHCDATDEEAHEAALAKIGRVKEMAKESENEKWIDITTGREIPYGGW